MEKSQIFIFGLSILTGFIGFIYAYEYSPISNIKAYFKLLIYCLAGMLLFSSAIAFFWNESIIDVLLGVVYFPKSVAGLVIIYALIVFVLLSIISDNLYPLIKPLIEKIKVNKQKSKFRTPKIK